MGVAILLIGVYLALIVFMTFAINDNKAWRFIKGTIKRIAYGPPQTDEQKRLAQILNLEHDTIYPVGEDPTHCNLCRYAAEWVRSTCLPHEHEWDEITLQARGVPFRVDQVCSRCGHRQVLRDITED